MSNLAIKEQNLIKEIESLEEDIALTSQSLINTYKLLALKEQRLTSMKKSKVGVEATNAS